MSAIASAEPAATSFDERLGELFDELAELTGQRNAIDGRIVEIVAEIERDQLWGATGARSIPALVAWKTGVSPSRAETIAAVAHRLEELPQCVAGLREGKLSLDQSASLHNGRLTVPMPTSRSWPSARLSASCVLRSNSNPSRNLNPSPTPMPMPMSPHPIRVRGRRSPRSPMSSTRIGRSGFRMLRRRHSRRPFNRIGTHSSPTGSNGSRPIGGRRCPRPPTHSCAWWRPVGTPRPLPARTGNAPRSSSMSMRTTLSPHCIWGRCSPTPTADSCPAMPPARRGSTATAVPSARAEPRGQ